VVGCEPSGGWLEVCRKLVRTSDALGGGRERQEGGPDSTVKPKLVCPKWWVFTSAGFCNDSERSQGVWPEAQH